MRSSLFDRLARTFRLAHDCERTGLSTDAGLARRRENHAAGRVITGGGVTRRGLLAGAAAGAALAALPRRARAKAPPSLDVGIVGAGLAGLVCADELRQAGLTARLYEASARAGGRQWSLRGTFPGQVAERGGELIDNLHKTMLGYVQTFGLTVEDMGKVPGEVTYFFDGAHVSEAHVVDEYRAFVDAMRDDLRASSGAPTADAYNAADLELDRMSLAEYLDSRGAGPIVRKAIGEAYKAEYGLELEQQSALNFLLFIHADRRSKFTPFGVYSDERYHVVEGNDAIASGLAARLAPGALALEHRLVRVAKTAAGRVELTFKQGNKTVTRAHDAVVLAVPFSVLRGVELDPSLALPAWKTRAIAELGYGANAKTMVGFDGPVWAEQGGSGAAYADLPDAQTTWETNPSLATAAHAVLTDYASGARGAALSPSKVQAQVGRFVADLDRVWPGAAARATRVGGAYLAHLEPWPSNPLSKGSYTCYLPGQFTGLAGNEGKPVGNLFFAGEHANSFYEWQGFMEGACLSGIDAAAAVLAR
jgi:monoamine oxidase